LASLSICFGVGMRQLAGRSVIPRGEHTKNLESSRPKVGNRKNPPWTAAKGVGTKAPGSS
jgi:hypothetical protein